MIFKKKFPTCISKGCKLTEVIPATRYVQGSVKTSLLCFEHHSQSVAMPTPKMPYGAIFQPAISETWQECFYTPLYLHHKKPCCSSANAMSSFWVTLHLPPSSMRHFLRQLVKCFVVLVVVFWRGKEACFVGDNWQKVRYSCHCCMCRMVTKG